MNDVPDQNENQVNAPSQEELRSIGITEDVEGLFDEFKQAEELTPELVQRMIDVYKILADIDEATMSKSEKENRKYSEVIKDFTQEILQNRRSFEPMKAKRISLETAQKLVELSCLAIFALYMENFDFIACDETVLAELMKFEKQLNFYTSACGGKKITKSIAKIFMLKQNTETPINLVIDPRAKLKDLAEEDALDDLRKAYFLEHVRANELDYHCQFIKDIVAALKNLKQDQ